MAEPRWRRYLRFWKHDPIRDVDDELTFHRSQRLQEFLAAGMSKEAAAAAVAEHFGDESSVRDELIGITSRIHRRGDRRERAEVLYSELKTNVRTLRRRPGFSVVVIITLALGLGVNAAIFSFLDRVYLRAPSGVHNPGSLRRAWSIEQDKNGAEVAYSATIGVSEYSALTDALKGDATLTLFARQGAVHLSDDPNVPDAVIVRAAANYFSMLGVGLQVGRFFSEEEANMRDGARVAVISDALWRSRYGGESSVLGKRIQIASESFTIIGVAARGFNGIELERTDVWTPLSIGPIGMNAAVMYAARRPTPFGFIIRLGDHTSQSALEAKLTSIVRRTRLAGDDSLHRVELGSIIESRGPGKERKEISLATRIGVIAVTVLIIACANVANLFLASAVARRREIAVRMALGSSRARLIWLVASQCIALALVAGAVAMASARITGSLLRSRLLPDVSFADAPFHWRVAAFTLLASVLTGALTGLMPAMQGSRADVTAFLNSSAQSGLHRSRLRSALVAIQAMFSVVLLVVAGLFVRSLYRIESIPLGYDVARLASASVSLPGWRSPDSATFAAAAERMRSIRGVEQVGMATGMPFSLTLGGQFYTATDSGRGDYRKDEPPTFMDVSANYFTTVGMRIVKGRGFDPDPGWTIVINEEMERQYWPRGDAIGQCMWLDKRGGPCYRVIGVAENAHRRGVIEKAHAHYFVPLLHPFSKGMAGYTIIVRATPDRMAEVTLGVQRILKDAFPTGRPIVETTANRLAPAYRPFRLGATLFTALGILALIVSSIGIYSSVAYSVTQRTREFGVRVALGAEMRDVVQVVLRQGMTPVVFGVAAGVAIALAGGKVVESLLYGVSPRDTIVMASVPPLLLITAVAAALIPSMRAARVDPVVALRAD